MRRLSIQGVNDTFYYCLLRKDDHATQRMIVPGVYGDVDFHKGRIQEQRQAICDMLAQLHRMFRRSQGACFLSANLDRLGDTWTDNPKDQDRLFVLGVAIDKMVVIPCSKERSRLTFGAPDIRVSL